MASSWICIDANLVVRLVAVRQNATVCVMATIARRAPAQSLIPYEAPMRCTGVSGEISSVEMSIAVHTEHSSVC